MPGTSVHAAVPFAAARRRRDARLVRDGAESRVGPEPADADRDGEEDQHEAVGFLPALDPPLALVEQVAADFVDLPPKVGDGRIARAGRATVPAGCPRLAPRLCGFRQAPLPAARTAVATAVWSAGPSQLSTVGPPRGRG